jgi:hypothetical protein
VSERPLLTVIVPTIGRHALATTLGSVRAQAPPAEVELLVVGDTHRETYAPALETVPWVCDQYQATYAPWDGGRHCYGQPQRQRGQELATGHWLAWLQDDDCWLPDALAAIRPYLRLARPLLFRAATRHGGIVWRTTELVEGNVDANCLVVPNVPARLGRWMPHYAGDYDMIYETAQLWSGIYWPRPQIASHGRDSG